MANFSEARLTQTFIASRFLFEVLRNNFLNNACKCSHIVSISILIDPASLMPLARGSSTRNFSVLRPLVRRLPNDAFAKRFTEVIRSFK